MADYIDGFVHPIRRDNLDRYRRLIDVAAAIWKEHGALEYKEFVGDDLYLEGTSSFVDAVSATSDEVILFGWVAFESREMRDRANEKVAADPRMAELMASTNSGFDPERMAYGGFKPLTQ